MSKKILDLFNEEETDSLNLTPLIDVIFVVLVAFILIAPLLQLEKIELAQGGHKKTFSAPEQSSIFISVMPDHSILINKKKIPYSHLKQELVFLKKQHQGIVPQLAYDEKASFGMYQKVKNTLEDVGFDEMDVLLR
ncbi:MAG TPA: biopolymer transporter ExbD [Chlamydiales bacterium]|nr:biopolymer transporter ExbD [Chlamydiales bacterium]